MLWLALLALAGGAGDAASDIVVTAPRARPFDAKPVSEPQLAQMRGGVLLPNGIAIAIGIDIQTRVDGLLVLHTIYASDGPIIGARVFTDGAAQPETAPGTITVTTPDNAGTPIVTVARTPTGTTVVANPGRPGATVNLVAAPASFWVTADGQQQVPLAENGAPVRQGPGSFGLSSAGGTITSTLAASDYEIRHFIGRVTGTAVTNTGNDRAIDTVSSVNIDLQGGLPALTPSLIQSLMVGSDAVRGR